MIKHITGFIALLALLFTMTAPNVAQSHGGGQQTNYVVWSPDGESLLLLGWNTIWLFDMASDVPPVALNLQDKQIFCAAFSPDGSVLAVGSDQVVLWDTVIWESLGELDTGTTVQYLAYSPDGSLLATVGWSKTILLWDVDTREVVHRLNGHSDNATSVAFSPDGSRLISGGRDNAVRLWNVESGESLAVFEGHKNWVTSVAYAPDGNWAASASLDGTVRLWDVDSGTGFGVLTGIVGHALSSVTIGRNNRLAAGDEQEQVVWLWDTNINAPAAPSLIARLSGPAESVAFDPNGLRLASGGGETDDEYAEVWVVEDRLLSPLRSKD